VKSRVTDDFVKCFAKLPDAIKSRARKNYRLWRANPAHPGLYFKRVHATESIYSLRARLGWRAAGYLDGDTVTWFGIGSHADYDKLLKQL
jgi:hypothetical protein